MTLSELIDQLITVEQEARSRAKDDCNLPVVIQLPSHTRQIKSVRLNSATVSIVAEYEGD